jgi:hypothetical protein
MARDQGQDQTRRIEDALDKFESGGALGPIEDRDEREQRVDTLPPHQKELAQESARFADLCQYFAQQKMDVPADIVAELGSVSKRDIPERIRVMKRLNQRLMEYLNDIGQDPGIRQ